MDGEGGDIHTYIHTYVHTHIMTTHAMRVHAHTHALSGLVMVP